MKKILTIIDSEAYIRSNCYQRQLFATLERYFDVDAVSIRRVLFPYIQVEKYDRILILLRQRTLFRKLSLVAFALRGAPVYVYDQDIWTAFMDNSPYKGAYSAIVSKLNVKAFLITSAWWSEFGRSRGFPTIPVRMGMLPDYCDPGPDWDERPIRLGFQGTLHPHRRAFYRRLAELGLEVSVLPSAPYEAFLSNLHRMRIYIHTEDEPWTVDGVPLPRNSLWIKETEAAARGTFAIRDDEPEAEAYDIAELPTIMPYRRVEDVPDIVAAIESMPAKERRERMIAAAETMRRRDDWTTVVRALDALP